MWQCENEDYQVQADVFKHEHSCRRKQDGENNEHLKKIFICAKLWEFIEHFDLSIERYFELNLKAWKPLSWRPENQIWEILEYSILMISNKPRLVAGGIWTAWSAYRPSWEGCPCCSSCFCSSAPRIVFRMSTNVKQLWLDVVYAGDNNVSCVLQCMITVNLIWLPH